MPRAFAPDKRSITAFVIAAVTVSTLAGTAVAAPPPGDVGLTRLTPPQVKSTPGKPAAKAATARPVGSSAAAKSRTALNGAAATLALSATNQSSPLVIDASHRYVSGSWSSYSTSGLQATAVAVLTSPQTTASGTTVRSLKITPISSDAAARRGLTGFALQVATQDGRTGEVALKVPVRYVDNAAGANAASRSRWIQLAIDGQDTPTASNTVPARFDEATNTYLVAVKASPTPTTVALRTTSTSAAGTGTFTATTLNPASTWQVSTQTGAFSTNYPMRVPPLSAGPQPQLDLRYNSQASDGATGSSNNQPGVVGEGWELGGTGYIERSFVACSQDTDNGGANTDSGDLCWRDNNATMSFAGRSGPLVQVGSTNVYRLQDDDGSRIENLRGAAGCVNTSDDKECWRLTTTDGTQYYFGLNRLPGWTAGKDTNSAWTVPVFGNDSGEPGYSAGSTFADRSTRQTWRWNLDYVVDTHGNAQTLKYIKQTNLYAKNRDTSGSGTQYVRAGTLASIEYGLRSDNLFGTNAAGAKIEFTYADRCIQGACNANVPANWSNWPDTPLDQGCSATCTSSQVSPSFWTKSRLTTVTTSIRRDTGYENVDKWELTHLFPDPGDASTVKSDPALWLSSIQHSGMVGGTALVLPPTTYSYVQLKNRVKDDSGLASLNRLRIQSITDELGGQTDVEYMATQCLKGQLDLINNAPQNNFRRCFPRTWTPDIYPPSPERKDLFHKHVVSTVSTTPRTGGDMAQGTSVAYSYGTPAWRYDTSAGTPDAYRTWSTFAGFSTAQVVSGVSEPRSVSSYTFYRGLDGDQGRTSPQKIPGTTVVDSLWLAGRTYRSQTLSAVGGSVLSDTTTTPAVSAVTAGSGTLTSRFVRDGVTTTTEPVVDGSTGTRTRIVTTTYDFDTGANPSYGVPLTVNDATADAGTTCTETTYAPANTSAWLIGLPQRTLTVDVACSQRTGLDFTSHVVSDERNRYDSGAFGAAPTVGELTETQVGSVHASNGLSSTTTWIRQGLDGYDDLGRTISSQDSLNRVTTTAYSPSTGPVTSITKTRVNLIGATSWTTKTDLEPAWGSAVASTDANNHVTSATYDALGRVTATWAPDRPKDSNTTPNVAYTYGVDAQRDDAAWIKTSTLTINSVVHSYALYDGFGRIVQTQQPSEYGGAVYSDTLYDSNGRTAGTVGPRHGQDDPSSIVNVPTFTVERSTRVSYDALNRVTEESLYTDGGNPTTTSYVYSGMNRVDVTPPTGGTPTTTWTDSRGRVIKQSQWESANAGVGTQRATTYTFNARGDMTTMTDPASNAWTWTYDDLGRNTAATDPDAGTTTTIYDAGSRPTAVTRHGDTIAYTYDRADRKLGQYLGTTTGPRLASWAYDPAGGIGLLKSSTRWEGATSPTTGEAYSRTITSYDAADRPLGETVTIPSGPFQGSYTTTATYTRTGKPATKTYTTAQGNLPPETLNYGWDTLDNPSGLTTSDLAGNPDVSWASLNYDHLNRVNMLSAFGLAGSSPTFDRTFEYEKATWRPARQVNRLVVARNAIVSENIYGYDKAGNVTSSVAIQDTGAHGPSATTTTVTDRQCLQYDALRNLTEAWATTSAACDSAPSLGVMGGPAPYWNSYEVDGATGNRTKAVQHIVAGPITDTYAYVTPQNSKPHAVSSVTTTNANGTAGPVAAFSYDLKGNTTQRPGQTLTWTADGHLASVRKTDNTEQRNIYGADGNLLISTNPAESKFYLGDTELTIKTGSSAKRGTRTYAMPSVGVLGERSSNATDDGTRTYYLVLNNVGSVIATIDTLTGDVKRRYQDPYGNVRGTAPTLTTSGHGYLNAPASDFTGLTHLGAREYDPIRGKFLSVDPILEPANPAQTNAYAYGWNNPLTNPDPEGTRPAGDTGDTDSGDWGDGIHVGVGEKSPRVHEIELNRIISHQRSLVRYAAASVALASTVEFKNDYLNNTMGLSTTASMLDFNFWWWSLSCSAITKNIGACGPGDGSKNDPYNVQVKWMAEVGRRAQGSYDDVVRGLTAQLRQYIGNLGRLISPAGGGGPDPAKGFDPWVRNARGHMPHPGMARKATATDRGERNEYDHVVERYQIGSNGITAQDVNNPFNLNLVPASVNNKKAGYYNKTTLSYTGGLALRDWLSGQSYSAQYEFGMVVTMSIILDIPLPK